MTPTQIFKVPSFYSSLFNDLGLEIFFLTIVLAITITIYKTTKESYLITKHKGIKYFRNAFLFFAIAFSFRFLFYLLSYIHNYQLINLLNLSPRMLGGGSMLVYTFTSSIALLSLLYALSYNKFKNKELPEYLIYVIGALISIVSFFIFNSLLIIHTLIALIIILSVSIQKKKSKKNNLGITYILLAIFWILSIFGDLFYFSFFDSFRSIFYSALILILLYISFRTIRRIK
ncbi:MAG: hypothetical protein OQK82_06730 [Candidatus Pacearchaeota archaeon]|nr:hypothetical protein [Candidatus Pacearchaeota archaeon]